MASKKYETILRLPQVDADWYIGIRQLRIWILPEEDEEPYRPYFLVIIDLESGGILGHLMEKSQPDQKAVEKLLLKVMKKPAKELEITPQRPSQIFFEDQRLMKELNSLLQSLEIRGRYRPQTELLLDLAADLENHLRDDKPEIPGLLSQAGVSNKLVGSFFSAAAALYRAAPWLQLSNRDVMAVRVLPQKEPYYVIVMGQRSMEYGFMLDKTWEDVLKKFQPYDQLEDVIPLEGVHSLFFDDITAMPFDDLEAIQRFGWEIAGPIAYPIPVVIKEDHLRRPNREELAWYEAVLRAIPLFTQEHLKVDDNGEIIPAEAIIQVQTAAGKSKVEIKIPAGELPDEETWTSRPDPFESDESMPSARDLRAMEGSLAGMGKSMGYKPDLEDDLLEAQEIIYDAWDEKNPARRISLAHQALQISENCADAYGILAEDEARTPQQALELFEKGVEAGRRALGDSFFQENKGHFWGILETRPFMRAMEGAARSEWILGRHEAALKRYLEMMRLNPNDNQGIRYQLVSMYLELNRQKELKKMIRDYDGDYSAIWKYTQVLLAYRLDGPGPKTERLLEEALEQNPYVPDYLTGRKRIPHLLSDYMSMGEESEAASYAWEHLEFWRQEPGAVEWLRSHPPVEARARNTGQTDLMDPTNPFLSLLVGSDAGEDQASDDLPLRKNAVAILTYLRDHKVTGTQATGNFPLKAVREITSQFVTPPHLESLIDREPSRIRSETNIWPLYFLHVLMHSGTLLVGGPSKRWTLTETGQLFLEVPPFTQVLYLLVTWWYIQDWLLAFPFIDSEAGLTEGFEDETLDRLLRLPVGTPVPFESFAEDLVIAVGLKWPADETDQSILMLGVEQMVLRILADFGILQVIDGPELEAGLGGLKAIPFLVTPYGRRLLEAVRSAAADVWS